MFEILPTSMDDFANEIYTAIHDFLEAPEQQANPKAIPEKSLEWFDHYLPAMYHAYINLGDDHSRRILLSIILFHFTQRFLPSTPFLWRTDTDEYRDYIRLEQPVPSQLKISGLFGELWHFDFVYQGERYIADCAKSIEYYLFRKQYYYAVAGVQVMPEPGDYLIDGGGCTGDSTVVFSNSVGPGGKVYCFDLIEDHVKLLEYNAAQYAYRNVEVMPYGLANETVVAPPLKINCYDPSYSIFVYDLVVPLVTLDSLVESGRIPKVDFIKLDVECSELVALKGSHQTILKFKPKLAISIYHYTNDFFDLVNYITILYPFYDLYVSHYTHEKFETVLYCKAKS
ncbi:MAG: FkbM family methyltransferase [Alphaproteobacteria bacterium]|nr:FkbM family methyltransferase [Alphaproteobacteria bacterium]